MRRVNSVCVGAALLLPLMLSGRPASAEIIFSDFSSINGLARVGNVQQVGTALRLAPTDPTQGAAVWYGSEVGVSLGFSTEFSFRLRDTPSAAPFLNNGFTFTVQDDDVRSLTRVGDEFGYGGLDNSVAVAFKPEFVDGRPVTTLRVLAAGDPNTSVGSPPVLPVPVIDDDRVHTARIVYEPATLYVYLDDMTAPALQSAFHLTSLMCPCDRRAFVGFTAGSETGVGAYDILSWRVQSIPEPGTLALLGAFGGLTVLRRRRPEI